MSLWIDVGVSLVALTILEIVLGIDNLIFLVIISQKLPMSQRQRARQIGLSLAWIARLVLLASAMWIAKLTHPIFTIFEYQFSWRDLFLIAGGIFLLGKSTQEIHHEFELDHQPEQPEEREEGALVKTKRFAIVITQIVLLDIIFSLDSVLTAIGLTQRFWLMAVAISIAIIAMLFANEPLSRFVERHPTIKMLALSFLMLIGMVLIADGFQFHIPRGYVYFALGFSIFIETLNMAKKKTNMRRLIRRIRR